MAGFFARLPKQLFRMTPFGGTHRPTRVPLLFARGRSALPFPHPWNYRRPIDILETYFRGADRETGFGRHNRYLDVPGFAPVLVTRDPAVIRSILTATGDRPGQFDRDTLPSTGIARATGSDTLLFGNGAMWRTHRKASASPFGKTALFQPEIFADFEETFRETVQTRLLLLRQHLAETGATRVQLAVEPEIKALMLELLTRCFFGAEIEYEQLRDVDVPALERLIDHIVRDTVTNPLSLPRPFLTRFSSRYAKAAEDFATFDRLTDRVLAARPSGRGLWRRFKGEGIPDEALRSNIKVFLAGALEATTSYATWTISHLARAESCREAVFREVETMTGYSPECLDSACYFRSVLSETLRLTPSLYFLPRRATCRTSVTTSDGGELTIPGGTHILLDIWHANRHEDHWGEELTGYPATEFHPKRWDHPAVNKGSKEFLHFGFGHGARVCPGKHLGELEVALVVGAFVKLFQFRAVHDDNPVTAGVSTKPADGTLVELELRHPSEGMTTEKEWLERMEG